MANVERGKNSGEVREDGKTRLSLAIQLLISSPVCHAGNPVHEVRVFSLLTSASPVVYTDGVASSRARGLKPPTGIPRPFRGRKGRVLTGAWIETFF